MKYLLIFCLSFNILLALNAQSQNTYAPGDIVPEDRFKELGEAYFFKNIPIPDNIFSLMKGKSYKDNCPIPRKDLRYLLCLHRDKDGKIIVGEMVVNQQIALTTLDILRELFRAAYPIEKMRLVDYYNADDELSMRDNNSSSFNYRVVSGTKTISKHGKGLAIDINPLYNPYYHTDSKGNKLIEPLGSEPYLDRSKSFPYKVEKGDLCHKLFTSHGFLWGGNWKNSKDYQHFYIP